MISMKIMLKRMIISISNNANNIPNFRYYMDEEEKRKNEQKQWWKQKKMINNHNSHGTDIAMRNTTIRWDILMISILLQQQQQ